MRGYYSTLISHSVIFPLSLPHLFMAQKEMNHLSDASWNPSLYRLLGSNAEGLLSLTTCSSISQSHSLLLPSGQPSRTRQTVGGWNSSNVEMDVDKLVSEFPSSVDTCNIYGKQKLVVLYR
mmetsp:Transcript_33446/g.75545  ORF Transcript_33446/g.75545 Transcript_33446/m.75545 type:complete len:121 (-) Transcript_33446:183-545(-)